MKQKSKMNVQIMDQIIFIWKVTEILWFKINEKLPKMKDTGNTKIGMTDIRFLGLAIGQMICY